MSFQTVLDARDAEMLSTAKHTANNVRSSPPGTSSASDPTHPSLIDEHNGPTRHYLGVPTKSSYRPRPSIDSAFSELSELSIYSDEIRRSRPLVHTGTSRLPSASPTTPQRGWRSTLSALWIRNKGAILVLLAQAFGSLMNVATRILETDGAHGRAMHPFQILFARQSLTSVFSLAYGYYAGVSHFPFGPRNVLSLLIARGVFGFFGVFGLYFALLYMPLAEATVLTFLAPILTCYVCAWLIPGESFSRQQQFAAFLSLVGVVIIARPASLFHPSDTPSTAPTPPPELAPNATSSSHSSHFSTPHRPTAHQHLLAVLVSMLGVIGGCGAMTAIRWIGTRAHPLISVNYFSVWCTIVSLFAVIFVPSVDFRLPANLVEWGLLASLGGCGYALQFLLTAGLAYGGPSNESGRENANGHGDDEERSPGRRRRRRRKKDSENDDKMKQGSGTRATNMVYTQMLFALTFDKLIWGITPTATSWAGSGLILGSAVWVAVARDKDRNKEDSGNVVVGGDNTGVGAVMTRVKERPRDGGTAEEEEGLMSAEGRLEEGESSRDAETLEMDDLSLRPRPLDEPEPREAKSTADRVHNPLDIEHHFYRDR